MVKTPAMVWVGMECEGRVLLIVVMNQEVLDPRNTITPQESLLSDDYGL